MSLTQIIRDLAIIIRKLESAKNDLNHAQCKQKFFRPLIPNQITKRMPPITNHIAAAGFNLETAYTLFHRVVAEKLLAREIPSSITEIDGLLLQCSKNHSKIEETLNRLYKLQRELGRLKKTP